MHDQHEQRLTSKRDLTWIGNEYPKVHPGHNDLPRYVSHAQLEVLSDAPTEVRVYLLLLHILWISLCILQFILPDTQFYHYPAGYPTGKLVFFEKKSQKIERQNLNETYY